MMSRRYIVLCAAVLLSACGRQSEEVKAPPVPPAQPAAQPPPLPTAVQPAPPAPPAPQVNITRPETPPTPKPVPEVKALASGAFKNGEFKLTKVKVTGTILTVEFQLNGQCCTNERIPIDQISYIDDASAKKFGVLKDESGQAMAAPLEMSSNKEYVDARLNGHPYTIWIKFPAPPVESKTISLNMPYIGALDGMPVAR